MPKRNAIKLYGDGNYYHCYNRGVAKMTIFHDEQDYYFLLGLLKRHLSSEIAHDSIGRAYPNYSNDVELIAFCLMPNHYHLLLYLKQSDGIVQLMRSVMTSYSRYYNKRYQRTGTLFEGRFLASVVTSDEYLWHVSRYIHLNPLDIDTNPATYAYSSLPYFSGEKSAQWLHEERLVETDSERQKYMADTADLHDYHELRDTLKHQLAN